MAETVEELSYNYEEEGKLVRRELKKDILTKGAWATVMFLFQELDRKDETWGEPKVSIVRFKKSGGNYRKQSSFNISSEKQARQIVEVIQKWYAEAAAGDLGPNAVEGAAQAAAPSAGAGAASEKKAAPKKAAPKKKAKQEEQPEPPEPPEPPEEELDDDGA